MAKKIKQEWISFYEDGKRYMQCKHCKSEYVDLILDVLKKEIYSC